MPLNVYVHWMRSGAVAVTLAGLAPQNSPAARQLARTAALRRPGAISDGRCLLCAVQAAQVRRRVLNGCHDLAWKLQ